MEKAWLPELLRALELDVRELPFLWDADFYFGPLNDFGENTYVLGEINVSSVYPFPDAALQPLPEAVRESLQP